VWWSEKVNMRKGKNPQGKLTKPRGKGMQRFWGGKRKCKKGSGAVWQGVEEREIIYTYCVKAFPRKSGGPQERCNEGRAGKLCYCSKE